MSDADRARDRIRRVAARSLDARTLREQLLTEIRQAVGFDAYAWLLTDPETAVGISPLAEAPCLSELPSLIRLKYLTEVNRWTTLPGPVARLSAATGGNLSRSLVWRELLSRFGVTDVASAVYRDHFGCWGFLDLWRIGGSFTPAEAAFLADIAGPVTTALRRSQATTFAIPHERTARGPGVMILSPDLEVRAQTPQTAEYLRALVPDPGQRSPIPAGAYNIAAQLLANEAGVDAAAPWARVHLTGGHWLTLRGARLGSAAAPAGGDIAISIEESTAVERVSLFGRACGLTVRERELLDHLATGCDTRQLGQRMFLSPHTVQDHLKSVFHKTGVNSRAALLARAVGHGATADH